MNYQKLNKALKEVKENNNMLTILDDKEEVEFSHMSHNNTIINSKCGFVFSWDEVYQFLDSYEFVETYDNFKAKELDYISEVKSESLSNQYPAPNVCCGAVGNVG